MQENREQYTVKITKELTEKLDLDMSKEYSVVEINLLLKQHNLKGGILKFEPTQPYSATMIIETLVEMDLIITDAIHKSMGIYEDKSRCSYCEGLFVDDEMFQVHVGDKQPYLCKDCRRKNKIKIPSFYLKKNYSPVERDEFMINKKNTCY